VGKIAQGEANLRTQELAVDLLGVDALAWDGDALAYPREVYGFLRSRANTIEGGTSEVNRNVLGERVLGLPREPDPWLDAPWQDVPRS
jgi:alkylation response protein AidB-like acyl-CoA dehydrogenase